MVCGGCLINYIVMKYLISNFSDTFALVNWRAVRWKALSTFATVVSSLAGITDLCFLTISRILHHTSTKKISWKRLQQTESSSSITRISAVCNKSHFSKLALSPEIVEILDNSEYVLLFAEKRSRKWPYFFIWSQLWFLESSKYLKEDDIIQKKI